MPLFRHHPVEVMEQAPIHIFVSSTSLDLEDFRAAACDAILGAKLHPVLLNEHLGPDTRPTVQACLDEVRKTQMVVLIAAFRRGWVPTKKEGGDGVRSITALEVDEARKNQIPVLAFLAKSSWPGDLWEPSDEGRHWVESFRRNLGQPAGFFEQEAAPALRFRAELKAALFEHLSRYPGRPPPLTENQADAVSKEIKDHIAFHEYRHAVKRLIDFAHLAQRRDLENKAVELASQLPQPQAPDRAKLLGEIRQQLLALVDEVYDSQKGLASPPAPPPSSPQGEVTWYQRERLMLSGKIATGKKPTAGWDGVVCRLEKVGRSHGRPSRFQLSDINLELRYGEITGVIGRNGSGKTTLLRIVAGALAQHTGSVAYQFRNVEPGDWPTTRRQIAFVEQTPPPWYGRVGDVLHAWAATQGLRGKENEETVRKWLHRLGLGNLQAHKWNELSGGYKMRFALARSLVVMPQLLILDEPLAPLDVFSLQTFLQDLQELARELKLPVLLSSQHIYEVEAVANQVIFLEAGRALFSGTLSALQSERDENAFEVGCRAGRTEIKQALLKLGIVRVEMTGNNILVRTERKVDREQVFSAFHDANLELYYFRDVSASCRRLFSIKPFEE